MTLLSACITLGTYAAIPAASIDGRLYFATDTFHIYRDNGAAWADVTPVDTTVGFPIGNGTVGTDVGALLIASHAGSVSECAVIVKNSDPAVALTFDILKNGVSVLSAPVTVAAGTAARTISTQALPGAPVAVAKHDIFQINVTSGNANWAFTAQLE